MICPEGGGGVDPPPCQLKCDAESADNFGHQKWSRKHTEQLRRRRWRERLSDDLEVGIRPCQASEGAGLRRRALARRKLWVHLGLLGPSRGELQPSRGVQDRTNTTENPLGFTGNQTKHPRKAGFVLATELFSGDLNRWPPPAQRRPGRVQSTAVGTKPPAPRCLQRGTGICAAHESTEAGVLWTVLGGVHLGMAHS